MPPAAAVTTVPRTSHLLKARPPAFTTFIDTDRRCKEYGWADFVAAKARTTVLRDIVPLWEQGYLIEKSSC